jgi:carboxymethylenebutenolidase
LAIDLDSAGQDGAWPANGQYQFPFIDSQRYVSACRVRGIVFAEFPADEGCRLPEWDATLMIWSPYFEEAMRSRRISHDGGIDMKKILIGLAVLASLALSSTVSAQDWAKAKLAKSPRHSEWVTVKHDGRAVETFVAYPESKDKRPVVLIIHEIFGLTDWVEGLADQVAEAGYIAVAPDLLSGMGPNGGRSSSFAPDKTMEAVSHLNPDQVTADLNAAADYGKKLPASNGKLFVGGFCWGGTQTFRFATNRGDLAAAFVFYGAPPEQSAMARITAPVYGFYAGDDARIGATVPDTTKQMKEAGKTYEPVTYDGAGHGFMRAGEAPDASAANSKARTDAWARWKSLMSSK